MMSDKETRKTQKRYDRFSRYYDASESIVERRFFRRLREETITDLKGKVLEIGVGTGKNLPYYTKDADVTGIDLSKKMLSMARQKNKRQDIKLEYMDAQDIEFKDKTFDYVIGTFVLCSIPVPVKALKEVKRVLEPQGKAIFVEHVLSKHKIIALWQHIHNPITSRIFGFNVNRDTKNNIIRSGLSIEKDERLGFFDIFRRFTCRRGGI